jgi:Putative MetA-pathway of phenol degradation
VLLSALIAHADEARDDAWWTGPMLAPNAATLAAGHALIEPYLFDEVTVGHFDASGTRHSAPREQDLGSLTYILYGLTDLTTVGMLPRFGYNVPPAAPNSSNIGIGDLTLQAGYGVLQYHDGHYTPAVSLVVQETLPTGRYDRLERASDGLGAGAYTTTLAVYSQDYFWMPNGRILRARLDVTYAFSSSASVHDQSVYGTPYGFSGHVYPGDVFTVDAAGEYSVTRNWVLALDVIYEHSDSTRVSGSASSGSVSSGSGSAASSVNQSESGSSYSLGFAPAIEYNFSSTVGVLLGVRIIEIGRNTAATLTPAIALNMVF